MLRVNLLRAFLFLLILSVSSVGRISRAQQASPQEQMTAILQAIPPYRPQNADLRATVRVFGSSSMDALAHGWANGFKKFHPNAEPLIHGTNSDEAFTELLKSPSSVAMLSRPVKEEELAELREKGLGTPVAFPVAREALAVFVNRANPATSITGGQLKSIFTNCPVTKDLIWSILDTPADWANKPIHVVSRTSTCGTQAYLRDFVFGSAEMREGVSAHYSNALVLESVSQDPEAIAICGMRSHGKNVKPLQLTAGGQAVPSDDAAVLAGKYPLTRPLVLVIDMGRGDVDALASQEFVRYALGQSGQTQTIMDGFFPVELPLMRAGLARLGDGQYR